MKSLYLLFSSFMLSLCTYFLVLKLRMYYVNYIRRKQEEKLDKMRDIQKLVIRGMDCLICYEKTRNIIIKPCKHLCLCRTCFFQLHKKCCPICKGDIKDFVEIFIP